MSRRRTFTSIIHLRNFVDTIKDDPTRENAPNYVEIQPDLSTFEEDEQRELYPPGAFFYADGRFFTAMSMNGTLEISSRR
ncbi:hypothetical protein H634G_06381 [Metarhizium anisopliae BRIP 53293]|uniref:Uncharacterized protein n=1 Tax=Metarhizium anisopliae BRIP 53293 TaxID=1291518 RepID=A0A0D9NWP1_METAN|nr:hypothetical protein H634G_06381 [Metarhizium anisopliae BRIP 53293]KJK85271.1 hypothetical protein H633G_10890 [Metarhizium anisopliae BRIP 53284]